MGFDLYPPQEWAEDDRRPLAAEIPPAVPFLEKWRIALRQLDRARRDGVLIDAVVSDAGYGEVFEFRESLRKRQLRYVVGVSEKVSVRRDGEEEGDSIQARDLAASLPKKAWRRVNWRKGTKGPLVALYAAVRVRPTHNWKKTGHWPPLEWLICEKAVDPGGRKRYYMSNLPPTTPLERLVALAHARWQIEEHFERLKDEIGIDQFEGTSWTGWHHHTALAAVTYAMLESERMRKGVVLKTFQTVRKVVRRFVFLMMLAEKNEDAMIFMHFREHPPPRWTSG